MRWALHATSAAKCCIDTRHGHHPADRSARDGHGAHQRLRGPADPGTPAHRARRPQRRGTADARPDRRSRNRRAARDRRDHRPACRRPAAGPSQGDQRVCRSSPGGGRRRILLRARRRLGGAAWLRGCLRGSAALDRRVDHHARAAAGPTVRRVPRGANAGPGGRRRPAAAHLDGEVGRQRRVRAAGHPVCRRGLWISLPARRTPGTPKALHGWRGAACRAWSA